MTATDARKTPAPTALRFGYFYSPGGDHPAGWRHSGGDHDPFDPKQITAVAQLAEGAGFDFVHLDERLLPDAVGGKGRPDALARTEPFTTASFLATRTRGIGFVVTANASYYEPFNLARLTASLDHVTHGRAGWNIVTGATRPAARNFSQGEPGAGAHYSRADEVVEILRKLWDSWEDDAFIRNKQTGEYVDGSKIHPINHSGPQFKIKGPLNVARPPQGQLVIAHDVVSDASADLVAREADIGFLSEASTEALKSRVEQIRAAAQTHGRDPASLTLLATVTPLVAASLQEARDLYDALNARIVLDPDVRTGGIPVSEWLDYAPSAVAATGRGARNLGALSQRLGVDVSQGELTDVVGEGLAARFGTGGQVLLGLVAERSGREVGSANPPTLADLLYAYIVGGRFLVGGPKEIADQIAALAAESQVDGVTVRSAYLPEQLQRYVDLVVPELKARGLLLDAPECRTLREHLGLAAPANRYAA